MKGFIVCGYPGVGKSAISGLENCIDLESSIFSHDQHGIYLADYIWVPLYCTVALNLADQGYTVLTSTHDSVLKWFSDHYEYAKEMIVQDIVIFAPYSFMKSEWIDRLKWRYRNQPTYKNKRAYEFVLKNFDKIDDLESYGLPVYHPVEIPYDLEDYIDVFRACNNVEE